MEIQVLSRSQLSQCVPYGRMFHAEFQLPGEFKPSVWLRNWQTFYDTLDGIVFGLWKQGRLVGGFGAIVIPDISDQRRVGQEMFIFVDPSERVGTGFLKLVRAFHEWADDLKLKETRLVHLHHKDETGERVTQAERLQRFYEKQGYRKLETCYIRERSSVRRDTVSATEQLGALA